MDDKLRISSEDEDDRAIHDLVRVLRMCRPTEPTGSVLSFAPDYVRTHEFPASMPLSRRIEVMRRLHSEAWWKWVKSEDAVHGRRQFLRDFELASALRLRELEAETQGAAPVSDSARRLVCKLAERLAGALHPRPIVRFAERVLEHPERYSHITLLAVFYSAFNFRTDIALGVWHFAEWKSGMRPFFASLREDGIDFPEGVSVDDVEQFIADNPGGFLHVVRNWSGGTEIDREALALTLDSDI
ncbi:hypothetical protein [Sulfuriroseicoccus oceanibius]|uniref:Uncharacterized protein n=1 Tax=Sulfuriroseicoccus oceanibius TaxID=2707525 RepID=A0A6B3L1W7_9BACT|nr:hypothetical protein [Sulfuriroseicoccus oceanibius]QQL43697.1 hypothetical protein G3M56_007230 [Sulfuriroseicoccus oceanibius]